MTAAPTFSLLLTGAAALARHPSLWWTALVQLRRLAPRGWWRRPPFLPVPDPAYVRFRLVTMYGDEGRAPDAHDLIEYLQWCRRFPSHRYPGGGASSHLFGGANAQRAVGK